MRKVEKPWGHELIWAHTDKYVGKLLHIKAGHRLSRQYHEVKDETILVIHGELLLELGQGDAITTRRMGELESYHVKPGTVHRFVAEKNVDLLEVSTPELDDVVRLIDDYGRAET